MYQIRLKYRIGNSMEHLEGPVLTTVNEDHGGTQGVSLAQVQFSIDVLQ